jgi:hypothetical protein
MPLDIDFEWQRDDKGYALRSAGESRHPSPAQTRVSLLRQRQAASQIIARLTEVEIANALQSQRRDPQGEPLEEPRFTFTLPPSDRIVRRGGELVTYRPFDKVDGLFRVFAGLARTREGLLDFVQRFGPLTPGGNNFLGEDVQIGIILGNFMNFLLSASPEQRIERLRQMSDGDGLHCTRAEVLLTVSAVTGRPQLKFKVNSLMSALQLEFAQALSSGEDVRQCAFCGEWFEAGPSARRRRGTKFCSDDHRIAFNSQKRTKRDPD